MDIYLIRHTSVKLIDDSCYGQTDVELSDGYKDEFIAVKQKAPELSNIKCYSSPLTRCVMLANFLCDNGYEKDDRLKEINLGDWEMEPWNFIQENLFLNWQGNFVDKRCPNGESFLDIYKRSIDFYDEVTSNGNDKIAIFTHMNVIRAIVTHILGLPINNFYKLKSSYGGVTKIQTTNNLTHLMYFSR